MLIMVTAAQVSYNLSFKQNERRSKNHGQVSAVTENIDTKA
jgi:hypothetical protein